jgi:hypothetical protein
MHKPLVVSYYTKNTLYQLEVQNLIASCDNWGIEADIAGVDSFGSWELNCAFKPFFILEKLKTHNRPLLWVDADGVFVRKPDFSLFKDCELSVRINAECSEDHPSKVITSTLYINYSEETLELIRLWAKECQRQIMDETRKEEFWDQIALRDVLRDKQWPKSVMPIPLSYAKIFDHPEDLKRVDEPVIEHFQASRRYKNSVNSL